MHNKQHAVVSSQGCKCVVFVPDNMVPARREAIEREGAKVVVVKGNYDDAIAQVHNLHNSVDSKNYRPTWLIPHLEIYEIARY